MQMVIVDPFDAKRNAASQVFGGTFDEIQAAFRYGASKLQQILTCPRGKVCFMFKNLYKKTLRYYPNVGRKLLLLSCDYVTICSNIFIGSNMLHPPKPICNVEGDPFEIEPLIIQLCGRPIEKQCFATPNSYDYTTIGASEEKSGFLEVEDYDIILMGKTEDGLKYLDKVISYKSMTFTCKIIQSLSKYPFYLVNDEYGHILFCKTIDYCTEDQMKLLLQNLTRDEESFYRACINRYGSVFIKKLINVLGRSYLNSYVVLVLHTKFKDVMKNRTAASVVMRCLKTLDQMQADLLYLAAINTCCNIAINAEGCLSLINFIEEMKGPRKLELLSVISAHAALLSKDPSGIIVVQYVLNEKWH